MALGFSPRLEGPAHQLKPFTKWYKRTALEEGVRPTDCEWWFAL